MSSCSRHPSKVEDELNASGPPADGNRFWRLCPAAGRDSTRAPFETSLKAEERMAA